MPRLYGDVNGKSPLQYFQKKRLTNPADNPMLETLKRILYHFLFEKISEIAMFIETNVIAISGLNKNAIANVMAVETDNSDISVPTGTATGNLSDMSMEIDKIMANKISFLFNMNLNLKEVYISRLTKSAVNTKINILALLGNFCTFNYI